MYQSLAQEQPTQNNVPDIDLTSSQISEKMQSVLSNMEEIIQREIEKKFENIYEQKISKLVESKIESKLEIKNR